MKALPDSAEIAVLSLPQINAIIDRTIAAVVDGLRDELQRPLELMTKGELAEYLRCDVSKINRYMKNGLPFEQFGGHPRFRKSDIDRWLKNERVQKVQTKTALSP